MENVNEHAQKLKKRLEELRKQELRAEQDAQYREREKYKAIVEALTHWAWDLKQKGKVTVSPDELYELLTMKAD